MSSPLLLHVFPSFSVGGAQVRLAKLANHFGNRWRHAVIALDGRTDCMERIGRHVELEILPSPIQPGQRLPSRLLTIGLFLNRLRPDALITSNWGSIEWAMARVAIPRLSHIHTEDGFGPEESQGQFLRRILTRRAVLQRSDVILPSQILLKAAVDSWKLSKSRVHYIPNGLDLRHFHPAKPDEARSSIPDAPPILGTIAALRPEKNLARLLRAAALLKQKGVAFRLMVLGDGPERVALEQLAASLDLIDRVSFVGHVSDPSDAYRTFDVFVLSSDTEQMPFSILEAMATGLPIASSDAGDIRIMVAPENTGFIAVKEDAALAAAMKPLLLEPALRRQLGYANRAKAERDYDQEQMFQAHAQLIDRACARPQSQLSVAWRRGSA